MLKPHLSANPTAAQVTGAAAAPPLPAMALVLEPFSCDASGNWTNRLFWSYWLEDPTHTSRRRKLFD